MGLVWGTAGDDSTRELSAWDCIFVGGQKMPGIAKISGSGIEHSIDVKKTPGKDGATFTDTGRELARFRIVLVLQNQADWDGFLSARSVLQPLLPTGKLKPQRVSHPAINALGVESLYFTRVGVPVPGAVVGTFEVELESLEYRATKNTAGAGTPKSAAKDVRNWERGGKGYAKSPAAVVRKPSKTNTGPS